jgi:hypothetical protein
LKTLNTIIRAAVPTAIASTLIHAMMLMAFADFFDLKYLHAKRKFKRRIFV